MFLCSLRTIIHLYLHLVHHEDRVLCLLQVLRLCEIVIIDLVGLVVNVQEHLVETLAHTPACARIKQLSCCDLGLLRQVRCCRISTLPRNHLQVLGGCQDPVCNLLCEK